MEYSVIVERKNEIWCAVIPTLSDLTAEGASYDEAVQNATREAENFLASVQVTTIKIGAPPTATVNRRSPQNWIRSAGKFAGEEEVMQQHLAEIYAERKKQREDAEHEADLSTHE